MLKFNLPLLTSAVVAMVGLTAASYRLDQSHQNATALQTQTASPKIDATTQPAGRFAELHSCELYTGGCTASSQEPMEGRYTFRVWQFDGGEVNGQSIKDLSVGLLETGDSNLAEEHPATHAVLYLPQSATPEQRTALQKWAQQNTQVNLDAAPTRLVSFETQIDWEHAHVSAGKDISLNATVPLECQYGSACGESLWYKPRTTNTAFVVDELDNSQINEPALKLAWSDHDRPTVFVGYFGEAAPTRMKLCGAAVIDEKSGI